MNILDFGIIWIFVNMKRFLDNDEFMLIDYHKMERVDIAIL